MTATRLLAGVELPAPGTWTIDPGHAEVAFIGRHFGLTRIRGRFTGVAGEVVVAERIGDSAVSVDIDMGTVTSGDPARDEHLRSAELFAVADHPTATFRSRGVDVTGASGRLRGDLTMRGVSRPVELAVEYLGAVADPWGNDRAVFSASTTIDRGDWGITWNALLETGGLVVSKQIRIEIDVELVRAP
jgi:polyisoprenoid-binding protein YceI